MNKRLRNLLIPTLAATAYLLLMRLLFGWQIIRDFASVMTLSFFLAIPFCAGMLTVALAPLPKIRSRTYAFFMPWLSIFLLLGITLAFAMEGWACWVMILPFFLIFSSAGGMLARHIRLKRQDARQKLKVSGLMLLPLLAVLLERQIPNPESLSTAYTQIDVAAPAPLIWREILRVKTIPPTEDHRTLTRWLGFPRPLRAELDHAAVGGFRKAIFAQGLSFDETVTRYAEDSLMEFSIKAYPASIPSTTMDSHILVGGEYFDVRDGCYRLEQLPNGRVRIHLSSHYLFRTHFNAYARYWGEKIMKDIQQSILQVVRNRAERAAAENRNFTP